MRLTALAFVLLFSVLGSAQTRVNPDAAVIADFVKRVAAYVALHHTLDKTLQEVPKDGRPEAYFEHQRALARLIQRERARAKAGDIYTKDVRAWMRRQLATVFKGPDGRGLKGSIMDEYTGKIRLDINGQYPESTPLSTMPTQVLELLPKLPEVVEYRFSGDRLILLDTHARLIVDYIEKIF